VRQRWPGPRAGLVAIALGGGLIIVGARAVPTDVSEFGAVPAATAVATDAPLTAVHATPGATKVQPAASPPTALPGHPATTSRTNANGFRPTTVQLPSLGVTAGLMSVSVGADGMLPVPTDVRAAGWWSDGAAAGASMGTVVLVGHVDSAAAGPGAFFNIRQLDLGDLVRLRGDGGKVADYTVVARREYSKNALPADVVFGQGTAARLTLVTCGGRFDAATHHYTDNVVLFAIPTEAAAPVSRAPSEVR